MAKYRIVQYENGRFGVEETVARTFPQQYRRIATYDKPEEAKRALSALVPGDVVKVLKEVSE